MTATLDPHLYTLPYLFMSSPILLSSILAIAAKFFRIPLYQPLLAHANKVIDRAVGLGHCDIGLIQSLVLIVCWANPTDSSSWLKLGIGIRLGYQLGLHLPRNCPLPGSELEARKIANHERTWYTLSSFDRLYSDVYSLPLTIKVEEVPDAVAWAKETAWLGCGDMGHACSFSSASRYRTWVRYRSNLATMSQDLSWAILTDVYDQIEQHMKHWFPADRATGVITEFEQVLLKWFDLNHFVKIKWQMIDFFGVMLYNLFSRLPHYQRRVVTGYVRRLSECCDSATLSSTDDETAIGIVCRFMRRLQHVPASSEEDGPVKSEVGEVAPAPNMANDGAPLDLDAFFLGMLQNVTDPFANVMPGQDLSFDPAAVLDEERASGHSSGD
ncbi:hypothetical protein CspeluHIS016_0306090 [Cutaneotrichosporon spelunceum]|uniref:Xylanolytic transcriptional activator regulatory domain-containing protein n=1 Tax=Cutaneotrichosporon spelunceum TaxID=1672016 RepID=A0AAD3YCE6_9TREE|nr:hypothetical protein CspeluHIS016_0306090 [Cutaneotrichosporon spelunceum]